MRHALGHFGAYREGVEQLRTVLRQEAKQLSFISFLHWAVVKRSQFAIFDKNQPPNRMAHDYNLFLSTFNGPDEPYIEAFTDVNADRVATRLQYDYCAAYLDFFADDPRKARAIAERYADHPVDRWREAFQTVLVAERLQGLFGLFRLEHVTLPPAGPGARR